MMKKVVVLNLFEDKTYFICGSLGEQQKKICKKKEEKKFLTTKTENESWKKISSSL